MFIYIHTNIWTCEYRIVQNTKTQQHFDDILYNSISKIINKSINVTRFEIILLRINKSPYFL